MSTHALNDSPTAYGNPTKSLYSVFPIENSHSTPLRHGNTTFPLSARETAKLLRNTKPQPTPKKPAQPAIIYRNSRECRPFYQKLHAFEGEQFGADFVCESSDYQHWFNSDAFFCVAAFAGENTANPEILSVLSMLLVTEESAKDFMNGKIDEKALVPFDKNISTTPVIYFSSLIATNLNTLATLYKMFLKDITEFKNTHFVAPSWGFSIVATSDGLAYAEKSGFKTTAANGFMNKYAIVTIDIETADTKLWTSIFSTPTSTPYHPEVNTIAARNNAPQPTRKNSTSVRRPYYPLLQLGHDRHTYTASLQ